MMHQAGIRRLLLFVALFRSVVLFASALPATPLETKPSASTQTEPAAPFPAAPFKEAEDYFRKGSFDQAIAKYNEVLKSGTQSAEAYTGIVRCYLRQDKARDAAETLEKGLQAKPSDPGLKVVQGELLFRQGRIAEAEKIFVQLINGGQAPARAFLGLANISSAVAMYAREHRLIVRAHELDPSDQDIQKEWMSTLSRADRIKFLETYLAQPTGDAADTRRGLSEYLEILKARQAAPPGACRLVSDVTATETELLQLLSDPFHLRGMGLPVTINSQKSKLLLDTGAGGITINRKLAARAGVQRMAGVRIGGVGDKGDAQGYAAYADSIRIGNLEFRNCPVDVIEKRSVGDEEGLIGADVFGKFLIEIDFPNHKLKLTQLPARPGEPQVKPSLATDEGEDESTSESDPKPAGSAANGANPAPAPKYFDRYIGPEMNSYARVFRFGHMLLVPTKINDVPGKLFLIDSGAFSNTITPDAAREVTKVHGDYDTRVKGLSGEVAKVYEAKTVVLEFGALRQKNEEMVAFDLSHISRDVGTEVSGTLGFPMLNLLKIKLDYRDALVNFEYVPDPRRGY
jgi:tetratricopeptide (TPR) repeat protein